jgi:hypothetical protein
MISGYVDEDTTSTLVSFRLIPIGTLTFSTCDGQLFTLPISRNPNMATNITFVALNLYNRQYDTIVIYSIFI